MMVLTIINNIFFAFMLYIYNVSLYEVKKDKRKYLLLGWGIIVFMLSLQKVSDINIPLLNICLGIVPYMVITYLMYNTTWKRGLLYTFFFYITGMICELICYVFFYCLLENHNMDKLEILIEISSNLLVFVVLRIFILISSKEQYEIKLTDFIGIFIIPFGSIILILDLCSPSLNNEYFRVVVAICVLLLFNISNYYLYIKIQENIRLEYRTELLEKKNKDYIDECKRITALWERISEFQHDMKYFSEIDKLRCSDFINASGFNHIVSTSGCVMLDAIINSKASYAKQYGINFEVDIELVFDVDYLLDDVSVLLYNLMDNAIEANKKNQGQKYIKLTIKGDSRNEKTWIIKIMNPYETAIKRSNNGEYITSKEDKRMHGYGLKSIKQIVEKHKGEIKIEDSENIFKVSIMLFDV
ncbi:MAG: ATP-binding protein [Lachnospiraceae bacterium]